MKGVTISPSEMTTVFKKLNKPYPRPLNLWKTIFSISFFVAFFLIIFQPFGLQHVKAEHKKILLAGYGLITFIILAFNILGLTKLFPKIFNEDKWTVKRQILWLCWIVISISIGNYLYSVIFSIFPWIGIKGLLIFLFFTFSIAFIPITGVTFITENLYLKKNLADSGIVNDLISTKKENNKNGNDEISVESGNQQFRIQIENLLFIESEGNYIKIWYLENSKVKNRLIRNTIKNIESEINNRTLLKCHRAFIVNLSYVEKVKGNSQGYSLIIKNIENRELPVARSYTKSFKESMSAFVNE